MKVTPTWILISDGAEARVYDYHGPKHKLEVVDGAEFHHANLPTRELTSTERGRALQPGGNSPRPVFERTTDPHEFEKQKFANELASFLEARRGQFERLVVAAPPKMLGYLRTKLSKRLQEKIVAAIDKDFTKAREEDLEKHLQNVIYIDPERRMRV